MSDPLPAVIVAGPTGSGKSALALDIADRFAGTVINADSMQVYRELRILTARPRPEDEARVPHRLYGVLGVEDKCSAGLWLKMAVAEIEDAGRAGRLPVIVGGTGLYLKVLSEGLARVPDIPAEVRAESRRLHDQLGAEAFHAELARLDPEAGRRLKARDRQRVTRAFEVVRATGRPLSEWTSGPPSGPAVAARFATVVLVPPREDLYAAVDARFAAMMDHGALDEVRALDALGLSPAAPAAKALGVPELRRHLAGETSLEQAREDAARATRNFAKRQLTWLRHQVRADLTIESAYSSAVRDRVLEFVGHFLSRPPN